MPLAREQRTGVLAMIAGGRDKFIEDRNPLFLGCFGIALSQLGEELGIGFGVTHDLTPVLRSQYRGESHSFSVTFSHYATFRFGEHF